METATAMDFWNTNGTARADSFIRHGRTLTMQFFIKMVRLHQVHSPFAKCKDIVSPHIKKRPQWPLLSDVTEKQLGGTGKLSSSARASINSSGARI